MRDYLKQYSGNLETYRRAKESIESITDYSGMGNVEFNLMVDEDICRVRNATGLSKEQAIEMAKNFVLRYPALMEYARITCEPSMIPKPKKKSNNSKVVSLMDSKSRR